MVNNSTKCFFFQTNTLLSIQIIIHTTYGVGNTCFGLEYAHQYGGAKPKNHSPTLPLLDKRIYNSKTDINKQKTCRADIRFSSKDHKLSEKKRPGK